MYESGIGREVGKVKWFVVKRNAIQAVWIEPASRRFQNRDRRIECGKSGESFEGQCLALVGIESVVVHFSFLRDAAIHHQRERAQPRRVVRFAGQIRSEEHTSEL